MTSEQADKIVSLLEEMIEQQKEILEKLSNLTIDNSGYGIESFDED